MSKEGIAQLEQEYGALIKGMDTEAREILGNLPETYFGAIREIDDLRQQRKTVKAALTQLDELIALAEEGTDS